MNIQTLIKLLEAKLSSLSQAKATAEVLGEIERVAALDLEINEVESTLHQMRTLL